MCAFLCEALFGLSYIFTKQATADASVLALLGWRFLIAMLCMHICVVFHIASIDLKKKNIKPLLIIAFFSPLTYFIGETIGISKTTASESGVFLACIPISALLASTFILHKKPIARQIAGILTTFSGILVTVFAVGMSTSLSAVGYVFLSIAVTSYAFYSIFVEHASVFTGAEITYVMLAFGVIIFAGGAFIEAAATGTLSALSSLPFRNTSFLTAVLYQGIGCSVIAFFLSNTAIAKIGVNRASSFIGIATVVSIISGVFFLNEPFSVPQMIGAVIIITGVCIANTGTAP